MEARMPIAQDQAFAESLSFDTAYRYSDYGDGVQTDTYKFGLEWAPIAGRPPARQLPAARSAPPTSSSCSRRRASTCSTRRAIPAAPRRRDPEASDAECIASGVPARSTSGQ